MEGVPGAASSLAFDEAACEPCLPARRMQSSVPSREGAVAALAGRARGVRGHVTSSARGRKSRDREAMRGGAVDRSSARTACALFDASVRGLGSGRTPGTGRGRWLKLEGRRQATLHPWICRRSNDRRRVGAVDRESPREGLLRKAVRMGIGWSVLGARGRKSVAEIGERHLSPSTPGASTRAGQRGDSLKRPVGL